MKLSLLPFITGLSGRLGKLVFCIEKKSGACWSRIYVKPELTENNHEFGSASKNLSNIYHQASEGYIEDLRNYSDRYNLNSDKISRGLKAYTSFTKMMYALKRTHPAVDLRTLSLEEIMEEDLPVRSVKEAVDNELLPAVKRYEELNCSIV